MLSLRHSPLDIPTAFCLMLPAEGVGRTRPHIQSDLSCVLIRYPAAFICCAEQIGQSRQSSAVTTKGDFWKTRPTKREKAICEFASPPNHPYYPKGELESLNDANASRFIAPKYFQGLSTWPPFCQLFDLSLSLALSLFDVFPKKALKA